MCSSYFIWISFSFQAGLKNFHFHPCFHHLFWTILKNKNNKWRWFEYVGWARVEYFLIEENILKISLEFKLITNILLFEILFINLNSYCISYKKTKTIFWSTLQKNSLDVFVCNCLDFVKHCGGVCYYKKNIYIWSIILFLVTFLRSEHNKVLLKIKSYLSKIQQKWQNIFEIQKLVLFTKPTVEKDFWKPSHRWRRIRRKICKVMTDPNKHRQEDFFAVDCTHK